MPALHWTPWERAVLALGPRPATGTVRELIRKTAAEPEQSARRQAAKRILAKFDKPSRPALRAAPRALTAGGAGLL